MSIKDLTPWNWFSKRDVPTRRSDYSLWNDFDREFNLIFEDFFRDFYNTRRGFPEMFKRDVLENTKILPKVDIVDYKDNYSIKADLPGVKEEDIDISVSKDGILSIKGKREEEKEEKDQNYYRLERSRGTFERELVLPNNYDSDNVQASFNNGILNITIAKKELKADEVKKIKLLK